MSKSNEILRNPRNLRFYIAERIRNLIRYSKKQKYKNTTNTMKKNRDSEKRQSAKMPTAFYPVKTTKNQINNYIYFLWGKRFWAIFEVCKQRLKLRIGQSDAGRRCARSRTPLEPK